ncbi:MAG: iron-containing alcohol dehydrogenase [Ketobacter sp.]|nr:MAG: iron-containing alcohol dehydrogenase [Ketobacter sp.]
MSNSGAFQYWQRSMIHAGPGTAIRLPNLFAGLGGRRVALISDKGLKDVGLVDKVAELFTGDVVPGAPKLVATFTDIAPDAESSCINRALAVVRESAADCLLAVGGGSVLDSVKMIKLAMYKQVGDIQELMKSPVLLMKWPEVQHMGVPHIAVPTTAGTGAEITNGAVIYNQALGIKHLILSEFLEADIAVLDAHMTTGLPPMLTAATGMDALTHAVETIAHVRVNDFALAHAVTSAKVILENLPKAVANGRDLLARQHMLNASAMACNSVVADFGASPVHNFSHAFGALFHIHHGEANGVLLPSVMEAMPEFYAPIADRLKDVFAVDGTDAEAVVLAAATKIRELLDRIGHPQDFKRHTIAESSLSDIVHAVSHDPLAALYPVAVDRIEVIARKVCGW